MSNLYIVGQDGHNFLKVGMTTRSVNKRIADWDTGSPFEWIIHFDLQVEPKEKLPALEAMVHAKLNDYRVRLEWFNASPQEACAAIADAAAALGVTKLTLHRSTGWFAHFWEVESARPNPANVEVIDNHCACQ